MAEPCPRDTAPCVGLAASIVARNDPEGTMIVMPADHVIQPPEKFRTTVRAAVAVIDEDPAAFVTFGIKPTRPETGYGYIERGEALGADRGDRAAPVVQFREKPDRRHRRAVPGRGPIRLELGHLRLAGAGHPRRPGDASPRLAEALDRVGRALGTPDEAATIAREYPEMEKIPIDKAVMEKATNVRVLEVVYDWNDVGDWRALTSLVPPDAEATPCRGGVLAFETRDSIIVSDDGGLIATLGVDDLVIVQSGGATLVARKDQLDKLKALVEGLDKSGFGSYL